MAKKKTTILIIILALVALAGSFAAAYFFFSHQQAAPPGKVKRAAPVENLDMGELIVNLSGGNRYLRVKLTIEYPRDKELTAELQKKRHIVADAIINALRSKTYTEVSAADSYEALKDSIIEEINGHLEWGEITGVFFTDFLIQ